MIESMVKIYKVYNHINDYFKEYNQYGQEFWNYICRHKNNYDMAAYVLSADEESYFKIILKYHREYLKDLFLYRGISYKESKTRSSFDFFIVTLSSMFYEINDHSLKLRDLEKPELKIYEGDSLTKEGFVVYKMYYFADLYKKENLLPYTYNCENIAIFIDEKRNDMTN